MEQISNDQPVSISTEDNFQRYEFSKRIASIVSKYKGDKSLVIGIYGKWGEGKTSVMNFVQKELPNDTVIVNFNPWMFSDEKHLLRTFFDSLAHALDTSIKKQSEKVAEVLGKYGSLIGGITQLIGVSGETFSKGAETFSSVSLEDLKKRLDEIIKKSGKTIAIFIDDIDRLDTNEIQYVFKLVKLIGDFPMTSYILSFDDEMVASALSPKYGGDVKSAGYNFLEKIIQMPLKIPKANKQALLKYTLDRINIILGANSINFSKDQSREFLDIFNLAFLPLINNPRMGVRYANTLTFSFPLLNGEVNPNDLMIVEGLKIFYPKLYDFVRSNSHLLLERTDRSSDYSQGRQHEIKIEINSFIETHYIGNTIKWALEILKYLFPQLKTVYNNMQYPDSHFVELYKEKRICTSQYFDRYFLYTVQEGDVPDKQIESLLDVLSKEDIELVFKNLERLILQYSPASVIQKLRIHESDISADTSIKLAHALARVSNLIPKEEGAFLNSDPYSQSTILVSQLLHNVPANKLLDLLLKLMDQAPIAYSMEINHWIMYKEQKKDIPLFPKKDEILIQEHIIAKYIQELTEENFFEILQENHLWRLLTWWAKSKKHKTILQQYLSKHLEGRDNPDFALKFLQVHTSTVTSYSDKGEYTFKTGLYKTNFDLLKKDVNVNLLNDNLISRYGMNPLPVNPSSISDREPVNDEKLVSMFQWFLPNSKKHNDKTI